VTRDQPLRIYNQDRQAPAPLLDDVIAAIQQSPRPDMMRSE
jgi:hypothetical protein